MPRPQEILDGERLHLFVPKRTRGILEALARRARAEGRTSSLSKIVTELAEREVGLQRITPAEIGAPKP